MARLKANKTSMHQLVKRYIPNLPPLRQTEFSKYRRTYWMDFSVGGDYHHIGLYTAGGRVYILDHINRYDEDKREDMYQPSLEELRELGMIEEIPDRASRSASLVLAG